MATAAKIEIAIEAQTAALQRGFDKAAQSTDNLAAGLKGNVAAGAFAAQAAMKVLEVAADNARAAIVAVFEAGQNLDQTARAAERLGLASVQLEFLRFAAERAGIEANTLDMALQRMTRRISEAAAGTGEAKGALEELGVSAADLNELAPDQAFGRLAKAFEDVENPADRLRLAFKLFDSEGADLVRLLNQGSEGLDQARQRFNELGGGITENAAIIQAQNEALADLNKSWKDFKGTLAIIVAPVVKALAGAMAELVAGLRSLGFVSGEAAESLDRVWTDSEEFTAADGRLVMIRKRFKEIEDAGKDTAGTMEQAQQRTSEWAEEANKRLEEQNRKLRENQREHERNIAAVTRDLERLESVQGFSGPIGIATAASGGFSAVREADRARQEAAQRDRERNQLLQQLVTLQENAPTVRSLEFAL